MEVQNWKDCTCISFVRPTLEYASIVWDGCSAHAIEKLETVQLHVSIARIVTGLPIFTSRESLYTTSSLAKGFAHGPLSLQRRP